VQPSEIENMNIPRLEFWLEVCSDIAADEERRPKAQQGN